MNATHLFYEKQDDKIKAGLVPSEEYRILLITIHNIAF
jgi:hypothetical protein